METEKPYAPACDRNRDPILEILKTIFGDRKNVLEIGSGTGQHAVYFSRALSSLTWQSSDQADRLDGIRLWTDEANLPEPIELDLEKPKNWIGSQLNPDAIFCANVLHIIPRELGDQIFSRLDDLCLTDGAKIVFYGPYNVEGEFTSESNRSFDQWLKDKHPRYGIRDLEWLIEGLADIGIQHIQTHTMPANNFLIHFEKKAT